MEMYCACGLMLVTKKEIENGKCNYCDTANESEYCEICGSELDPEEYDRGICYACVEEIIDRGMF